jgi:hypothetical protein
MFPIERPSKSIRCQAVPPSSATTIKSTSNPRAARAIVAKLPCYSQLGKLAASATACGAMIDPDRPRRLRGQ